MDLKIFTQRTMKSIRVISLLVPLLAAAPAQALTNEELSQYAQSGAQYLSSRQNEELSRIMQSTEQQANQCVSEPDQVDQLMQSSLFANTIQTMAEPQNAPQGSQQALQRFLDNNDLAQYVDNQPGVEPVEAAIAFIRTTAAYAAIACNDQQYQQMRSHIQNRLQQQQ